MSLRRDWSVIVTMLKQVCCLSGTSGQRIGRPRQLHDPKQALQGCRWRDGPRFEPGANKNRRGNGACG